MTKPIDTHEVRRQLRKHGDLPKHVCAEMADEIDRLRAKIKDAQSILDACPGPHPEHCAPYCDHCNPWTALYGLGDD